MQFRKTDRGWENPCLKQGITSKTLQRQIVAVMIGRFNGVLKNLAADFPGAVYHVDCRKVVGTVSKWHDELHPKNDGYFKVAKKFDAVIKQALSDKAPSPTIGLDAISEGASIALDSGIKLAKLQKLDNQDFLNLVVKRAKLILKKNGGIAQKPV